MQVANVTKYDLLELVLFKSSFRKNLPNLSKTTTRAKHVIFSNERSSPTKAKISEK